MAGQRRLRVSPAPRPPPPHTPRASAPCSTASSRARPRRRQQPPAAAAGSPRRGCPARPGTASPSGALPEPAGRERGGRGGFKPAVQPTRWRKVREGPAGGEESRAATRGVGCSSRVSKNLEQSRRASCVTASFCGRMRFSAVTRSVHSTRAASSWPVTSRRAASTTCGEVDERRGGDVCQGGLDDDTSAVATARCGGASGREAAQPERRHERAGVKVKGATSVGAVAGWRWRSGGQREKQCESAAVVTLRGPGGGLAHAPRARTGPCDLPRERRRGDCGDRRWGDALLHAWGPGVQVRGEPSPEVAPPTQRAGQ